MDMVPSSPTYSRSNLDSRKHEPDGKTIDQTICLELICNPALTMFLLSN